MTKHNPDENKEPNHAPKHLPKINKRKLENFLASICEAGGMTGKPSRRPEEEKGLRPKDRGLACQGPCVKAEWRGHLDIPSGILCVSATWSRNSHAERHRDVTIALTYLDERGKTQYSEMAYCDSEVRWLMETLWHAPIWD
jgi:hypothetical protein